MQVQKPESANKAYGYSRDSGSSRQPERGGDKFNKKDNDYGNACKHQWQHEH